MRGAFISRDLAVINICCISQEFKLVAIHPSAKISPTSPTRL